MVCIDNSQAVLHPFDPEYRSRNQIPIEYVPGTACINFTGELLEPVLSSEDIDLLQRYCGLILIGGNRAPKILMMIGEGGTGKGTITRLIALVIGRANVVQLRVDQLTSRFETARVVGKLLLNVIEATANYLNREGAEVIKALCGHDPMEAEKKYKADPISFDGDFPIIVTSNEALNVRLAGDESAQARRLAIIDFPQKRPGFPANTQGLVKAELEIVNWRRGSAHRNLNTALPRRNFPNDHDGKDPRFGRLGSTLPVAPG